MRFMTIENQKLNDMLNGEKIFLNQRYCYYHLSLCMCPQCCRVCTLFRIS